VRAALLTASDSCARGERVDASGERLRQRLEGAGWEVVAATVVADEPEAIAATLRTFADDLRVDLVLTTGGTGFSPRDRTPEATAAVLERRAPGIAEALRADGLRRTPHACLSRGEAGLRGGTLVVNLPGSLRAVDEGLDLLLPLLPHALAMMRGEGH
jgi:molybdopterin adenylyltransferase